MAIADLKRRADDAPLAFEAELVPEYSFSDDASKTRKRRIRGPVSTRARSELYYQIAVMEGAGIPLLQGLEDMRDGDLGPTLSAILEEVIQDVSQGMQLSASLARFPKQFPVVETEVFKAGESSGHLEDILQRLAEYLEWRDGIKRYATQVMIYPTILGIALIGLIVFLLTFLIPRLMGLYISVGGELPAITRFVMGASEVLQHRWREILAAAAGALVTLMVIARTERGGRFFDYAIMRVPLIGKLLHKIGSAQFLSTFNTLFRAGVNVMEALKICASSQRSRYVRDATEAIKNGIERGETLAEAVTRTRMFPALVGRMFKVGEQSGRLDHALDKAVAVYDREVPATVKKVMAFVEPTIIVIAGAVVTLIVLAAILPVFQMYSMLSR